MKFSYRKTIKNLAWSIIVLLLSIYLYGFLIEPMRVNYSKKRVEKSSLNNYKDNKEAFNQLASLMMGLDIIRGTEIEFRNRNVIEGYFRNRSKSDVTQYDQYDSYIYADSDLTKFSILNDGRARVTFEDTIIILKEWGWKCTGSQLEFMTLINHAGISNKIFGRIEELIKQINCEAFKINKDKSISLRYDGTSLYQYEYRIIENENSRPLEYTKLNDNIYSGLYDSGLYCAIYIFKN